MKAFKYVLIGVAALLVLLAAAAGYVAATFDPNAYKPQIIALVKEKTDRTLTLEGNIKLSFWPDLGVQLGRMSLSQPGSDKTFASMESGRVSLAILPLLAHKLVVKQLTIRGLRANIVRAKSARGPAGAPGKAGTASSGTATPIAFDIAHVVLEDATIDYRDEGTGAQYVLSGLDVTTGHLAPGTPTPVEIKASVRSTKPAFGLAIDGKAKLTLDLDRQRYQLDDLALVVNGRAAGITDLSLKASGNASADLERSEFAARRLTVSGTGLRGKDKLALKLDAPQLIFMTDKASGEKVSFSLTLSGPQGSTALAASLPGIEGSAQSFHSEAVALDIDRKQGKSMLHAHLSSPLTGNLDAKQFDLPKLKAVLTATGPDLPGNRITGELAGNAAVDVARERLKANLAGKIADSRVKARIGIAGFTPLGLDFDVDLDRLDLARFTASKEGGKAGAAGNPADQSGKPLDLTALRDFNGSGTLRIGTLNTTSIQASDVRLGMKAAGGRVVLNPTSATLYRGRLSGAVTVNAAAATPTFAVKEALTGVDVGPLLHALAKTDTLEGKGNVSVNVTTHGNTAAAMKKTLSGTAAVKVTNGAVKGIDLVGVLERAQAVLGTLKGEQVQQTDTRQRTTFSDMSATFNITNGIARNDDLSIKSPLLQIGGAGLVNIGESTIDYTVRASVVATAQGPAAQSLAALRGVTIPVRVTGPIAAPAYRLDFGALITGAARRKVEEAVKKKLEERLGGGSQGQEENKTRRTIENSLQRLFGR